MHSAHSGDTAPGPAVSARPSRRWLWLTAVLCGIGGLTPFAQALELLGISTPGGIALQWQAATVLVWVVIGPRIANRWSLTDSEAGALGGLGLLTIVATATHATIAILLLHPSTPYSSTSNWIIVALGVLPTHAVTAGLMSLVGSWTSARRQRERAADREAVLAAHAVRAELDALRTRLQPHFLLNALNTVTGLARSGNGERAADVAADLGELLRFALTESGDTVSFDAEREIVERYLAIEQVRLGARLRIAWQIQPDARTTQLPALTWQPLVENAIRHGIAQRVAPGTLTLSASRTAQALTLVVDADGPDHTSAPTPEPFGGLGIGLSTLRRRLALLYGDRATLAMTERPGGTRVELSLPIAVHADVT
ncbi:histidine kinase [Gemmatimonas sp.]|uniref:sensor histidine kinase n=1 Tax=Gemmatimonas sp. TaxID=1962908 RepID=UPI00286BEE25|nr:histidine kinase [Gemmatimonas sp.]